MDDFNISLDDAAGEYHYWPRDQVKVEVEDKLAGHRALLPKYSDADIHNHDRLSGDTQMKSNAFSLRRCCRVFCTARGSIPTALTLFKQPADVWPTYNGDYSGPPLQRSRLRSISPTSTC